MWAGDPYLAGMAKAFEFATGHALAVQSQTESIVEFAAEGLMKCRLHAKLLVGKEREKHFTFLADQAQKRSPCILLAFF